MPWPASASKRSGCASASPRSCAARTIASPSGCSLPRSADGEPKLTRSKHKVEGSVAVIGSIVTCQRDFRLLPFAMTTSVTTGLPSVIVPVLSSTTV